MDSERNLGLLALEEADESRTEARKTGLLLPILGPQHL
jgi:hypothetical protein